MAYFGGPSIRYEGEELPAALVMMSFATNPQTMQNLRQTNRALHDAIVSNNVNLFADLMNRGSAVAQHQRQYEELNQDPYDVETQRRIEEQIRLQNVENNLSSAMEYTPEVFAQIYMLYIPCSVQGVSVKAFVDSGAQSTIMSVKCAERCGIMRLIDTRFAGIAKGVGSAKILGRVHMAQIKIGEEVFLSSFTIMEGDGVDFLLGLDMLRKHRACIDLKDNVLRIGEQSVPFLGEADLPTDNMMLGKQDPTPERPLGQPLGSSTTTSSAPSAGRGVPAQSRLLQQEGPQASTPSVSMQPSSVPVQPSPEKELKIKQLMEMGFPREQATQALQAANGDIETAAQILLASLQ